MRGVNKMRELFVKTTDPSTADKLIKAGFPLADKSGNVWTFINNAPRMIFDADTENKIVKTNIYTV